MTRESRGSEDQQKTESTPSVYLYSSIPSMNKKQNQQEKLVDAKEGKTGNSRGLKLNTLKKDGEIEQLRSNSNIVISKENTGISNVDESLLLRKESTSPISSKCLFKY